jgi:hypothetical protein
MKKLLAVTLIVGFAMGLTACGDTITGTWIENYGDKNRYNMENHMPTADNEASSDQTHPDDDSTTINNPAPEAAEGE